MTKDEAESLSEAWLSRWGGSPIAYELRDRHADRWVRFHSLPASKRYAETEEEYGVLLDRHHTVLAELGTDDGLFVIVGCFEDAEGHVSPGPRTPPGAVPWLSRVAVVFADQWRPVVRPTGPGLHRPLRL